MPRPFPERFDPYDWQGPRARAHRDRRDAFQQLIGHAVQEIHGFRAHVSATSGRDGSIDAFIEDDPVKGGAFKGWPLPLILECKDHGEGGQDLAKNIQAGWSDVREKLAKKAEAGWPGSFAPWTGARTYVYCISSRLPSQAARDALRDEIQEFFRGLREENRPPLQEVVVLDWSDLRSWLDRLPRVADAWLGTEAPSIVGHEQFLEALVGFRQYLLAKELPYVLPDLSAPTHPDRLFERLVHGDSSGVLLVGVGGVGKTRLSVEVAERASAAGWRVLHAGAGDSELEVDVLGSAVLTQGSRTLIVLDYLDQMHRLDPGALRHRLLPEARRRGQTVALLATARPGAAALEHPEWQSLLTTIALTPSEEQVEAITEQMLVTLAPHARAILGKERLRRLCGHRPILTLFLARELERRAIEGLLNSERIGDLREGDLLQWLRLRLEENMILVPAARGLIPPDPEEAVVAAAAVLAAAPSLRVALIQAAAVVLGERSDLAQSLVDNLAAFGWLEPSSGEWSTAHDVVADEVLEQVLRLRPGTGVRPRALRLLLTAGLQAPRTLGRFALALRRLILASADEPRFAENVTNSARDWLRDVETELASTLAVGDPDEVGYALGSLIAGPPWDEPAFERWDVLLGPWLDRWKEGRAARHLLYVGLRHRESISEPLIENALAWLRLHSQNLEASFILAPLLERAEAGLEVVNFSLAWLAQYPKEKEGRFVLPPLLARPDLGERAAEAIGCGLAWLARYPEESEGQFVLHSLLARPDLGERAAEAIGRGLAWLARYPEERDGSFVLRPLLDRLDLGKRGAEAIEHGLAWLARYSEEKEGQYVLQPLLGRPDLGERAAEAIGRGLAWLARYPEEKVGNFVLRPLLARPDLGDSAAEVIGRGLAWLARYPEEKEGQFVLHSLLGRPDLGERTSEAIKRGLAWLARYPEEKVGNFVLRPLLDRPDLGDSAAEVICRTLAWLAQYPLDKDAGFILPRLLEREELKEPQRVATIAFALNWLGRFYAEEEPDFILKNLFTRYTLEASDFDRCVRLALQRVEAIPLDFGEASFLLRWVLSAKRLTSAEASRAVERGLAWCERYATSSDAKFVLKPILRRKSLSDEDWLRAFAHALSWLRSTPHEPDRDYILISCLARPHLLTAPALNFLRQDALEWCQVFPEQKTAIENLGRSLQRASEGLQASGVRAEDLFYWVKSSSMAPPLEVLTDGIEQAQNLFSSGRLDRAGFYLALLLPLTFRWGTHAQQAEVRHLGRRFLGHADLQAKHRTGFIRVCLNLVERGAWIGIETGRQALVDLGVMEGSVTTDSDAGLPVEPRRSGG